jgi:hypothetical protein
MAVSCGSPGNRDQSLAFSTFVSEAVKEPGEFYAGIQCNYVLHSFCEPSFINLSHAGFEPRRLKTKRTSRAIFPPLSLARISADAHGQRESRLRRRTLLAIMAAESPLTNQSLQEALDMNHAMLQVRGRANTCVHILTMLSSADCCLAIPPTF